LLYSLVFPAISYEMERFMRMSFINHMIFAEVYSDNVSRIEGEQMRAIVGNMVSKNDEVDHTIGLCIDVVNNYDIMSIRHMT